MKAWLLREQMDSPDWGRRHAERIGRRRDAALEEIERALAWVRERREPEAWALACALARLGCQRARAAGRNAEADELAGAIQDAARQRDDLRAACEFAWELYWITRA